MAVFTRPQTSELSMYVDMPSKYWLVVNEL
jgi:hypothetical protein